MDKDLFDENASFKHNIVTLSQGNPGAANVLTQLLDYPQKAVLVMEDLDKMNMYGPRIWLGFKDYCGEDLQDFMDAVLDQDEEMVELINDMRADSDEPVKTVR